MLLIRVWDIDEFEGKCYIAFQNKNVIWPGCSQCWPSFLFPDLQFWSIPPWFSKTNFAEHPLQQYATSVGWGGGEVFCLGRGFPWGTAPWWHPDALRAFIANWWFHHPKMSFTVQYSPQLTELILYFISFSHLMLDEPPYSYYRYKINLSPPWIILKLIFPRVSKITTKFILNFGLDLIKICWSLSQGCIFRKFK